MEKLYNNIVLPQEWPPQYTVDQYLDKQPVPYLENPPEVIDISLGRQLFVDDFLIEKTDLVPEYHKAKKYEGNPIFKPEMPWELENLQPCTTPKGGGVWYDKKENKFKMWYEASWLRNMAYAESEDGIHWNRPNLDIEPGTNKILTYDRSIAEGLMDISEGLHPEEKYLGLLRPDSTTVWIDDDTTDVQQRYKMFLRNPGGYWPGILMTSPDGIHWENTEFTFPVYDRSTMFYNAFRKKWVYSIRDSVSISNHTTGEMGWIRTRAYAENDQFLGGFSDESKKVHWLSADRDTLANPYIGFSPQLYNVDAIAYESIMIGMFQVMRGPENDICEEYGTPKITELLAMYSRDGFHFTRPTDTPIINASIADGEWDKGYVQSVGGTCMVVGDEIWIYYTGFAGEMSQGKLDWTNGNGIYANGATGLAKLRRDGFVSMNAQKRGTLLTKPLIFTDKKYLFANFNGKVKVTLLDCDMNELVKSAWTEADCTCCRIDLGDFDIYGLSGKTFRMQFEVENGKLYSFWFSHSEQGESGGYTGAGYQEV